jgi:hypothetical protein
MALPGSQLRPKFVRCAINSGHSEPHGIRSKCPHCGPPTADDASTSLNVGFPDVALQQAISTPRSAQGRDYHSRRIGSVLQIDY